MKLGIIGAMHLPFFKLFYKKQSRDIYKKQLTLSDIPRHIGDLQSIPIGSVDIAFIKIVNGAP